MRRAEPRSAKQLALPKSESASLLMGNQSQFRAFLRRRLRSDAAIDDLLQNALAKALRRPNAVKKNERVVRWFYRILRRALVDHYRSESA